MKRCVIFILLLNILGGFIYEGKAQTLTNYVQQKQKELVELRRVEKAKYEKACQSGSLDLLKEYLKQYPKGKYVRDVKNRIIDFDLWSHAVSLNTISSYENYLRKSHFKSFSQQAYAAITELNSIAEWEHTKKSGSIQAVRNFITKYPNSSRIKNANNRIHELRAIEYYKKNDLIFAYHEFNNAGGKYALDYSNRDIYDKCEDYYDYKQISSSSSESTLLNFLKKHPSSAHANEISNLIAVSKAQKLTLYSGEYTFEQALSYAKDSNTRSYVEKQISIAKKEYARYKRQLRKNKHDKNGRLFQFGFEMMDLAFNPSSYEDEDSDMDIVWYYNIGLSLKIGNFRDPVQFEVGLKPGIMGYTVWDDYYDESETKFHMPLFAKLKVNLCDATSISKVYLNANVYYNAVREDYLENEFAFGLGGGIAWYHWDWSVFYKADIQSKYNLDNDFLGTSLIYYF